MKRRSPRLRGVVALVAAYALVLQALLSSLGLLGQGRANPLDSLAAVICLSSGNTAIQDKGPDAPKSHWHDACCILCAVPGLDAAGTEIRVAAPDYLASYLSPVIVWRESRPLGAAEMLPIQPRAPPRLA